MKSEPTKFQVSQLLRDPDIQPSDDVVADLKQMGKLRFVPLVLKLCSDEMFEAVFALADFRKSIK